jgi:hypothetical protein
VRLLLHGKQSFCGMKRKAQPASQRCVWISEMRNNGFSNDRESQREENILALVQRLSLARKGLQKRINYQRKPDDGSHCCWKHPTAMLTLVLLRWTWLVMNCDVTWCRDMSEEGAQRRIVSLSLTSCDELIVMKHVLLSPRVLRNPRERQRMVCQVLPNDKLAIRMTNKCHLIS